MDAGGWMDAVGVQGVTSAGGKVSRHFAASDSGRRKTFQPSQEI